MAELIANRYSSALFQVGEEMGKTKEFFEELKDLRVIFSKEKDFNLVLNHPKVTKREKKELIDNIFGEKISGEIKNFLYILIDKNRQRYILDMIDVYENFHYEKEGILRVVAVTAMEMTEDEEKRLIDALSKNTNNQIEMTNRIDKDTIGGVRLEIEGKLIDGTIQSKLNSIARSLKEVRN